jgi:glyoxylase-like metal-dependent hydrolase (beta-lactamase superfamily II)
MSTNPREVADGVFSLRTLMVNLFLVREGSSWVLVDAGLRGFASDIRDAARRFLGSETAPSAIVLTHGHFDHVGSLDALLATWDVPVYAHRLERPYLTGLSPYPPPDPLVGRGAMALLSRLYPRGPIDVGHRFRELPDANVPGLADWRWVHTPGHTAGHVSLFRDRDRTLIAGDALTTTKQESMLAVVTQRLEMHGPPAYYTQDWAAAKASVQRLAALEPELLVTGHGEPFAGPGMRSQLHELASHFDKREVPSVGRYARQPAVTDDRGIVSLPPDPLPKVAAGVAIAAGVAWGLARARTAGRA